MILKIGVKNEGKVDYASLKQREGAQVMTLILKKLYGSEVEAFIQEDIGGIPTDDGWLPYPNDDRTPFKISEDGVYFLLPSNNFIQLRAPAPKPTLDMLTIGMNLRGKTFTFNTAFDSAAFLSAYPGESFGGVVFNNDTGTYGGLGIRLFGYSTGSAWAAHQLGFGKPLSAPPSLGAADVWADVTGWKKTTFTMPNDKDYIITSGSITDNALAKAVTVDIEMPDIESPIIATLS